MLQIINFLIHSICFCSKKYPIFAPNYIICNIRNEEQKTLFCQNRDVSDVYDGRFRIERDQSFCLIPARRRCLAVATPDSEPECNVA